MTQSYSLSRPACARGGVCGRRPLLPGGGAPLWGERQFRYQAAAAPENVRIAHRSPSLASSRPPWLRSKPVGARSIGRLLQALGHQVKLIAPQLAKPYVKRGKNDVADAEALCEAMSRPTMRFVPVKTADQQAALMLMGVRDRLIRQRTQLINVIRGYAAEFGLIASTGLRRVGPLLDRIKTNETLPGLVTGMRDGSERYAGG